jgi:hypothetical protein
MLEIIRRAFLLLILDGEEHRPTALWVLFDLNP